jgi:hypothetical protein
VLNDHTEARALPAQWLDFHFVKDENQLGVPLPKTLLYYTYSLATQFAKVQAQ